MRRENRTQDKTTHTAHRAVERRLRLLQRLGGGLTRKNMPAWAQLILFAITAALAIWQAWGAARLQRLSQDIQARVERPYFRCYYVMLPIDDYERPFPETTVTLVQTAALTAYRRVAQNDSRYRELDFCFIENIGQRAAHDADLMIAVHSGSSPRSQAVRVRLEAIAPKEIICVPLSVWTYREVPHKDELEGGQDLRYPVVKVKELAYLDPRGEVCRYVVRPPEPYVTYYLHGYGGRG